MKVFPSGLEKSIDRYRRAALKQQEAEEKLINRFGEQNWEEIELIIRIIKEHGQPWQKEKIVFVEESFNKGEIHGEDIVILHDLAEANRQFIGKDDYQDRKYVLNCVLFLVLKSCCQQMENAQCLRIRKW